MHQRRAPAECPTYEHLTDAEIVLDVASTPEARASVTQPQNEE